MWNATQLSFRVRLIDSGTIFIARDLISVRMDRVHERDCNIWILMDSSWIIVRGGRSMGTVSSQRCKYHRREKSRPESRASRKGLHPFFSSFSLFFFFFFCFWFFASFYDRHYERSLEECTWRRSSTMRLASMTRFFHCLSTSSNKVISSVPWMILRSDLFNTSVD